MINCSNCNSEVPVGTGLMVRHNEVLSTAICDTCLDGAEVVKLVLRRNAGKRLGYDQYSALEMSKKAFGV